MEYQRWKKNVLEQFYLKSDAVKEKKQENEYELEIKYEGHTHQIIYNKTLQKMAESLEGDDWEIYYHYIHVRDDILMKTTELALIHKKTKFLLVTYSRPSLFDLNKLQFVTKCYYSKEQNEMPEYVEYEHSELTEDEKRKIKKMKKIIMEFEENHGQNRLAIAVGEIILDF